MDTKNMKTVISSYICKKEQEKNSILDINPEFILSLTQAVRLPA